LLLYGGDGQVSAYAESDVFTRDAQMIGQFDSAGVLEKITDQATLRDGLENWDWFAAFYPVSFPINNEEKAKNTKLIQFAPDKPNYRMTPYSDTFVGIASGADLDAALAALQALYTDEPIYTAFSIGIEDTDWKMEGGFSTSLYEGYDNRQVYEHYLRAKPRNTPALIVPGSEGTETDFPAPQFRFLANAEKKARLMTSPGFAGTQEVPNIIALRAAYAPLAMLPDTLESLKAAGLDDYVAEAQKAYDDFLKP
jgi:hypothetical protein